MATEMKQRRSTHAEYAPSPVPRPIVTFFAVLRQLFGKAESERETTYDPPTVSHSGTWEVCISVEEDEVDGGYVAECLDVPGAMAQGETKEQALTTLIDAVNAVIAAKMEERFAETNFSGRKIGVRF